MIHRTRAIKIPDQTGNPVEENVDGWPVILRFEPAEADPVVGLTDLSHRPKAVVQGETVKELDPPKPGLAKWTGQRYIGSLTQDEAVIFDLTGPMKVDWRNPAYTDMTEAWVLLAMWGPQALPVMQRLVEIDIERPELDKPFYLITKNHAINVQIVNLKRTEPGFLIACNRSHGQNLFDTLLHAGAHLGLKLVGMEGFEKWLIGSE